MCLSVHAWQLRACFVWGASAPSSSPVWKVDPLSPVPLPFVQDEWGRAEIQYMTRASHEYCDIDFYCSARSCKFPLSERVAVFAIVSSGCFHAVIVFDVRLSGYRSSVETKSVRQGTHELTNPSALPPSCFPLFLWHSNRAELCEQKIFCW